MRFIVKPSKVTGMINIPPSKSHTIRAVAFAALARGESLIQAPLSSADTLSALEAAAALGCRINKNGKWAVKGFKGFSRPVKKKINIGNSGTTLRIFTALAGLSDQKISFDGDASIRQRSMAPLLASLQDLGAKVQSERSTCPFTIQGPLQGGSTVIDGISSQYVTALLMVAPFLSQDSAIKVTNLHEIPYIEITLNWLKKLGIKINYHAHDYSHFHIPGRQQLEAFNCRVAADFSSSLFALAAAVLCGSKVVLKGLDFKDSQGDKQVFDMLRDMGADIDISAEQVVVNRSALQGRELDLNNVPDALPVLAVIASQAVGETRLVNVEQARYKECDRITATACELRKMGITVTEKRDGLVIQHSPLQGAEINGYHDHRMVMAFTVAGLAAAGQTVVNNAEAVAVTYPGFIADMQQIGAVLKQDPEN